MIAPAAAHPTGRQHELRWGRQRATVVQVGGGLRAYEVDGLEVLDGYGVDEMAGPARGQVLAPWPNRLGDGCYTFDGATLQLPLSEPARHNAIHGLVRWTAWDLLQSEPARVRLGHVLWPQSGYPFLLALEALYELSDAGLRVELSARNAGDRRAPFGIGQHPYVRPELGTADGWTLRIPAATWLEADDRQLPTGRRVPVAGSPYDFREPRKLGDVRLDTAFTDLERDADGMARVALEASGGTRSVTVWLGPAFRHLMVFTGDTLDPAARRRSLGIEPMTCAPDAFRNGDGLVVLEPGERVAAAWGIAVA